MFSNAVGNEPREISVNEGRIATVTCTLSSTPRHCVGVSLDYMSIILEPPMGGSCIIRLQPIVDRLQSDVSTY